MNSHGAHRALSSRKPSSTARAWKKLPREVDLFLLKFPRCRFGSPSADELACSWACILMRFRSFACVPKGAPRTEDLLPSPSSLSTPWFCFAGVLWLTVGETKTFWFPLCRPTVARAAHGSPNFGHTATSPRATLNRKETGYCDSEPIITLLTISDG